MNRAMTPKVFYLGVTQAVFRGLLLALRSGVPGGVHGTIWDARHQTRVCYVQGQHPSH